MKPSLLLLSFLVVAGCARTDAAEVPGGPPAEAAAGAARSDGSAGQQPVRPIDVTISDRVRDALLRDTTLAPDAGAIRVSTRGGVVTLAGFVRTEALKQRAASVARAVGSVTRVENQLVVDPEAVKQAPPMESAVDHMISVRVRLALEKDRTIAAEARQVGVRTKDGVVVLTGTVSSETVKKRIAVVARGVGSVTRVDNELAVKAQ